MNSTVLGPESFVDVKLPEVEHLLLQLLFDVEDCKREQAPR